jgi:hypothetical protein
MLMVLKSILSVCVDFIIKIFLSKNNFLNKILNIYEPFSIYVRLSSIKNLNIYNIILLKISSLLIK